MIDFAKQTLGADGLKVRYTDRRVENYDTLDKTKLIDSRDIHGGLVDTYSIYDLSQLSSGLDESEQQYFEKDLGCEFGGEMIEVEIDFDKVVEYMAEVAAEYFESEIKGLALTAVSVYSPSEYNYQTDSCEWYVVKNPFDTTEQLVDKMRKVVGELDDSYRYNMYEKLDEFMYENITGYTVAGKSYTFDELTKKFGGAK